MEQLLGRSLGAYQLIERLEPDGALTRFRAIDRRLFDRPVIVNVFDFDASVEDLAARFERVAAELVELRHPCIAPLQDFGEQGQHAYVVSPYIEATRLSQVLLARPYQADAAFRIIAALADALDHAHRRGIVHRAIAPATIALVSSFASDDAQRDEWPLFTAFGYAAIDERLPLHPDLAPYQPPESGSGIDYGRVDLYSLAAVLVALLTGQPPPSDARVRDAVLAPAIAPVLRRALSYSPMERFGTGAEFVAALREAASTAAGAAPDDPLARLDEARAAVAAGRYRAAGRLYTTYLEQRPDDEMARREFVAIQSRIPRVRAQPVVAPPPAAEPVAGDTPATQPEPPGEPEQATEATPPDTGLRQLLPIVPDGSGMQTGDQAEADTGKGGGRWSLRRRPGSPRRGQALGGARPPAAARTLPSTYRAGQSPEAGPILRPLVAPAGQRQRLVLPSVLAAIALLLVVTLVGGTYLRRGRPGAGGTATGHSGTPPGANVTINGTPATANGNVPAPAGAGAVITPSPASNVIATIPIAPTGRPVTPTPPPTPPPLPPVLVDEFGDPNSGFPRQPGTQSNPAYWNGEYIIVVPTPGDLTVADLAGKVYGDLVIEVDVRAVGPSNGGLYGLVFHKIENQDGIDEYFLLIDPAAGAARLVRWAGITATDLLPMTPNPAIKTGDAVNHIQIIAKANMITVNINGVRIIQVTGSGPQSGTVGLRADAGTAQFEAHFDNFIIRPAP